MENPKDIRDLQTYPGSPKAYLKAEVLHVGPGIRNLTGARNHQSVNPGDMVYFVPSACRVIHFEERLLGILREDDLLAIETEEEEEEN